MVKLKRKKKPPDRLEKKSQELQSASEVGFARFQAPVFFLENEICTFSCCFDVFVSLIASGGAGLSGERSGGPLFAQLWNSAPIFAQIWKSAPIGNLMVLWCFGRVMYIWRVVWNASFSLYSLLDLVNDGGVSSAGVFRVRCDCSGLFWTFGVYLRAVLSLFLLPGVVQVFIHVQACGSSRNGGNEAQLAAYFISGGSCLSLKGEQFRIWSWKFLCVMFFGFLPVLLVSSTCLCRLGPVRMGYVMELLFIFVLVCNGSMGKHSKMTNASGGGKMSRPSLLFQICQTVMDFLWMKTGRLDEMGGTTIGWSQAWFGHSLSR